jgi:hypothetical protein
MRDAWDIYGQGGKIARVYSLGAVQDWLYRYGAHYAKYSPEPK